MTAPPLLRCPVAPDGHHVPVVADVGKPGPDGRPLEATYQRVCLLCKEEL